MCKNGVKFPPQCLWDIPVYTWKSTGMFGTVPYMYRFVPLVHGAQTHSVSPGCCMYSAKCSLFPTVPKPPTTKGTDTTRSLVAAFPFTVENYGTEGREDFRNCSHAPFATFIHANLQGTLPSTPDTATNMIQENLFFFGLRGLA